MRRRKAQGKACRDFGRLTSRIYRYPAERNVQPRIPLDNAIMENLFGTHKTEYLYRAHFTTRKAAEKVVAEYVYLYNDERINLKNGLTPAEIRSKTA